MQPDSTGSLGISPFWIDGDCCFEIDFDNTSMEVLFEISIDFFMVLKVKLGVQFGVGLGSLGMS